MCNIPHSTEVVSKCDIRHTNTKLMLLLLKLLVSVTSQHSTVDVFTELFTKCEIQHSTDVVTKLVLCVTSKHMTDIVVAKLVSKCDIQTHD